VTDQDRDIYFLYFVYKGQGWDGGLLYGWNHDRSSAPDVYKIDDHNFVPYFRGTFGPVDVQSELWFATGELEGVKGFEDVDVQSWAWNVELGFDLGPVGIGAGFAYTTGDDDPGDDDKENFLRSGGMDWQPLLIMTGYYMDANLGCFGNLNMRNVYTSTGSGLDANVLGYTLFYLTADWAATENVTLDAAFGYAEFNEMDHIEAANPGTGGWDDGVGWEFDVGLTWKLMENLKYNAKVGYFSEGDFWEKGNCDCDTDYELSAIHALTVTF
jgi:predicted porin